MEGTSLLNTTNLFASSVAVASKNNAIELKCKLGSIRGAALDLTATEPA